MFSKERAFRCRKRPERTLFPSHSLCGVLIQGIINHQRTWSCPVDIPPCRTISGAAKRGVSDVLPRCVLVETRRGGVTSVGTKDFICQMYICRRSQNPCSSVFRTEFRSWCETAFTDPHCRRSLPCCA